MQKGNRFAILLKSFKNDLKVEEEDDNFLTYPQGRNCAVEPDPDPPGSVQNYLLQRSRIRK
jgi:hypothetical protein